MSKNRLAVAAMAFVIWGLAGCGERGTKRLPLTGFNVAFESHKVAMEMGVGEKSFADVTVKNISPVTWPSKPNSKNLHAVNLAYHWLNRDGQMVVFDGERTPLPHDLKPGESASLKAVIHPPERAGFYILEITLVQEGVAWFPERGGAKLALPVNVTAKTAKPVAMTRAGAASSPVSTPAGAKGSAAARAEKRREPGAVSTKADKPNREVARNRGSWSVQVGSYPKKKDAEQSTKKLINKGYDTYIVTGIIKGQEWHRVRVGRLASREEAEKLRETLRSKENLVQAIVARPQ